MANKKFLRVLPLVAVVAALAFAPMSAVRAASVADGNIELVSPMLQGTEPVTIYNLLTNGTIPSLDPQEATDAVSIIPIENLFLGLTDIDPKTTNVRPEMATEWTQNEAGDVWTFKIRSDVAWVRWDPAEKKATELRKVTAADFEYGGKRICDPRVGSSYSAVAAAVVKGCDVVFKTEPDKVTDADFDQIAIKALDDTTLEITTQGARPYFESISGLWFMRATPKEVIDEFGKEWTKPGNIVTNGPFVLDTYEENVQTILLKNPLWVSDVNDNYGGNAERVLSLWIEDGGTAYSLYLNNQIDTAGVPRAEIPKVRADPELSKQVTQGTDLAVFYFGFAHDKEPFDKVGARRAFSAVVDRNLFVNEIRGGRGVPMAHFMPPGIFGAVPVNEVGVGNPDNFGFDPEYAKAQLADAGYPECADFPNITVAVYQGAETWAEHVQNQASTLLGCDASKVSIEALEFSVLLQAIKKDKPTAERPNMWTLGWGPDYPDAHNWVHDVLSCNADNPFARECTDVDKLIDEAGLELDGAKRAELYRQVEEMFFGADGAFPIAPIFLRINFGLVKPWYVGFFDTDGLFGGPHYESRTIDQEAQLKARGGANVPVAVPTAAS